MSTRSCARSDFQPGDRILAADHEYNAILNAAAFVAARDGATLDVAALPFPVDGPEAIIEGVLDAVRPRTRLAVLSAITSPTAVVMPIVDLAHALTDRGIEVLVDGAHAPGQVPVDIAALEAAGVSYWTGNAHKWLCAPKGSGILWVRRDRQSGIRPLVISHGANAERDGSQPASGSSSTGRAPTTGPRRSASRRPSTPWPDGCRMAGARSWPAITPLPSVVETSSATASGSSQPHRTA